MFSPVFLAELFVTDSEYISSDNSRLDLDNFCTNAPENDSSLWYISSFLFSLLPLAPHQQRTNNHVYQNISYLSSSFWTLLPFCFCWHFIFGDAHICQREPNNVAQGKFLSSSNSSFAYCGNRKYSLENSQWIENLIDYMRTSFNLLPILLQTYLNLRIWSDG